MTHPLLLAGLILPLALDTFAIAAVLGVAGIAEEQRLRTSLVLACFEAGMPIVGFVVGGAVGLLVGSFAGWLAIGFLVVVGALMLRSGDEEKDATRLKLLGRTRGLAVITLGLAVSVDELAIGFGLGLLGLPILVAVVWIGVQAFLAAQVGMRIGASVGEKLRERTEQAAGLTLLGMATLLMILKVAHSTL